MSDEYISFKRLTLDASRITNLYLLDLSILVIFFNPQAWHTDTAFVDHAVVKFILGPTSRITPSSLPPLARGGWGGKVVLLLKKLSPEKFSGSNVSASSHLRISSSSFVSGALASILKQCSVSISLISDATHCLRIGRRFFFFEPHQK